ncbi:hypothetical protein GOP47_0012530 [Adiantum capillus-veneris]|uniref:Glycosyltransferase N-terminal domain-containing protein n=1 Tax=Adiantum capillus-veneris TaxID=13818 RepID=A0A9D4UQV2_ADICA|nr:hypothetical protein GOP47_0012530 [Adiantum capillus-veneris]
MAMAREKQERQQHVVAVPLPAQGHLNPLMRFCKLLAKQQFTVTFVDFDFAADAVVAPPLPQQGPSTAAAPHSLVQRARIPIRRSSIDPSNGFNLSFLLSIAPDLEQLILSLNRHGPPVTCLLSDFNITFPTQDVADKLGIPRIVLYPCCASRLLFTHYLTQVDLISLEEVKEASATTGAEMRKVFRELPGLPTLCNRDIPHFKHANMDDTVSLWTNSTESWQVCNTRAHAVVVNSFEDLEASTFATLSKFCNVAIYDVGFWVKPLLKETATSLMKEDEACLSWLDQQPTSSVLYISFGTITVLSKAQYEEFVNGLLSSQQRFLWVLRPGLVEDIDYTATVASIVSESHDQPLNARCIVDEWKVGLRMECRKEDTSLIDRVETEKVIRALMEGPEGKFVRDNVTELKERSDQCIHESGSSYRKLKALIESLK